MRRLWVVFAAALARAAAAPEGHKAFHDGGFSTTLTPGEQPSKSSGGSSDESDSALVTVIINTRGGSATREHRVVRAARLYLSPEYENTVHKVVVCWDVPQPPPASFGILEALAAPLYQPSSTHRAEELNSLPGERRFEAVRTSHSSRNNRWIATLSRVRTELVLALDDDVLVLEPAIRCLIKNARAGQHALLPPQRRVDDERTQPLPFPRFFGASSQRDRQNALFGPFVKKLKVKPPSWIDDDDEYVVDGARPEYGLILPRLALVPRAYLKQYGAISRDYLRWLTRDPVQSDDIVINLIARRRKRRVLLPPESVFDYALCDAAAVAADSEYAKWYHDLANTSSGPIVAVDDVLNKTFWKTVALRTLAKDGKFDGAVALSSTASTCDVDARGDLVVRDVRDYETRRLMEAMTVRGQRRRDALCAPLPEATEDPVASWTPSSWIESSSRNGSHAV